MITAYTPTFAAAVLHFSPEDSMMVTLCIGVSNFVWLPIMGALSDRIGRRIQLMAVCLVPLVTAYPVLSWLVNAPSFSGTRASGSLLTTLSKVPAGHAASYPRPRPGGHFR